MRKSIIQARYRANLHLKNGTKPCWTAFSKFEVKNIIELRKQGETLASIAKKYHCSISAIHKRTKHLFIIK